MIVLFFLLLSQVPTPDSAQPDQVAYLSRQLEVAKKGDVYLTIEAETVSVRISGLELKVLPFKEADWLGISGPAYSRIRSVAPITTFTPAVKYVEEIQADREGTVESKDEVISVEEMPHTYLIVLDDQTKIWIEGDGDLSFVAGAKARFLEMKSDLEHYWAGIRDRREPVIHLSMTADLARQLYWVAKVGTPVFIAGIDEQP